MTARLRLVKVVVTPVFVADDGEVVEEVSVEPVVVGAREWPAFASDGFPKRVEEWEAEMRDQLVAREETEG